MLIRGRTTFVIVHRLIIIQKADQILVIENGDIVERGKHKELLASDGDIMNYILIKLEYKSS